MSDQPEPAVGQLWREVGRSPDRFVMVRAVSSESVRICKVQQRNGAWVTAYRAHPGWTSRDRFNGKRGNYEYVE